MKKLQVLTEMPQLKISLMPIFLALTVSFGSFIIHPAFAINDADAATEDAESAAKAKIDLWRHKAPDLPLPRTLN